MGTRLETMGMAFLIWVCTLPLVGLFILPWLGWRVALGTGLGLLVFLLILCWLVCSTFPSWLSKRVQHDERRF
ncbi:MAG TPA: hypothetical protein VNK89_04645 [Thermoflexus sp.]|nr:hypothetical protein [Thermoflexus sp.]